MQALAREFNLSETVFVLPPSDRRGATYRARIFTPGGELPFAGHPSVGAAVTATRRGPVRAPGTVVQECGAGLLPIEVTATAARRLTGGTADGRRRAGPGAAAGGGRPDRRTTSAGPAAPVGRLRPGVRLPAGTRRTRWPARRLDWAAAARLGNAQVSVFAWDAAAPRRRTPGSSAPASACRRTRRPARRRSGSACGWSPAACCPATASRRTRCTRAASCTARPRWTARCRAAGGAAVEATVTGARGADRPRRDRVPPFVG